MSRGSAGGPAHVIRFVVRWLFRCFVLFVLLVLAFIVVKDDLAKSLIEARLRRDTGMDVRIGRLEMGLFSPTLTVEGLKLYNSAEFGGSPFLDIPDLHLVYYPGALAKGQLRLKLARITVTEVNVVEARNGRTNLVLALPQLESISDSPAAGAEQIAGLRFAGIDILNLTLGKVRLTSLRHPGKGTEIELDLRNQVLTQVRSMVELRDLVVRALFRHGITIVTPADSGRKAR